MDKAAQLTWPRRLSIASGIASALSYFHPSRRSASNFALPFSTPLYDLCACPGERRRKESIVAHNLGLDLRAKANLYQKSRKTRNLRKNLLGPLASGLAKGVIFYYTVSAVGL